MRPALIVIDMQNYFRDLAETISKNVITLIGRSHEKRIPVIFTQHHDPNPRSRQSVFLQTQIIYESEDWQLYEPIKKQFDSEKDTLITAKCRYDAFWNTNLKDVLLKHAIDTVIITGVMTNLCCETTARSALCNDFDVIFLSDANATSKQEWHDATLENMKGFFGKVLSTEEVLGFL